MKFYETLVRKFFEILNGFCDIWIWDLCFHAFYFITTLHVQKEKVTRVEASAADAFPLSNIPLYRQLDSLFWQCWLFINWWKQKYKVDVFF